MKKQEKPKQEKPKKEKQPSQKDWLAALGPCGK